MFISRLRVADGREVVRHSQVRLRQARVELQCALCRFAHLLASFFERNRSGCDADPVHAGESRPGRREIGIDCECPLVILSGALEIARSASLEEEASVEQLFVQASVVRCCR
jgi:hypothetical protein